MSQPSPQQKPAAHVARPKAFRRPPHWVSPTAKPTPESELETTKPAPRAVIVRDEEPEIIRHQVPVPTHTSTEPAYGILLVAVVVIVNLLVAVALSQAGISDTPDTSEIATTRSDVAPAPDVTLFTTPLSERRTARYLYGNGADDIDTAVTTYLGTPSYETGDTLE